LKFDFFTQTYYKMNWEILICLSITLLFSSQIFSQQNPNYLALKRAKTDYSDVNQLLFYCRKNNDVDLRSKDIPWKKGVLLTTTNDTLVVPLSIDIPKDEIVIQIGKTPHIIFQKKVKAIAVGNKVYIATEYPEKDQLFYSYFELISEGNVSLLLKNNHDFYYKEEDKPAQKIKNSRKNICNILQNTYPSAKQIIKDKRLRLKDDEDLKELFYYLNNSPKSVEQ